MTTLHDLLLAAEEAYEHYRYDTEDLPPMTYHEFVADQLRSSRDEVLEALDGTQDVYDLDVLGPTILWAFS